MTVMSAIKIELRAYLKKIKPASAVLIQFFREFDPGSGRTLAACLTHASRASGVLRNKASGGRVSNTWATCLIEGNSLPKGRLIPHKIVASHEVAIKGAIRYEMGPRRIS